MDPHYVDRIECHRGLANILTTRKLFQESLIVGSSFVKIIDGLILAKKEQDLIEFRVSRVSLNDVL
jgi:hypothetical protein